jgi:hypothetical protein
VYGPIRETTYRALRQAAFSGGAMIARNWLRDTLQGQDIEGVVTAASQSFHLFNIQGSFIEVPGCGREASDFSVLTVGPDLLEALIGVINAIRAGANLSASPDLTVWANPRARDQALEHINTRLREIRAASNETISAAANTWQTPTAVDFGCVFGTGPVCQQLLFDQGISPVYTLGPGQNPALPAAILTLVFDNVYGDVYLGTPLFLPVRKFAFQ